MKGRVTSVEAMPVKLDFGGEKSLPLLCRGKTDCYAVCGDHRKVVEGIVTRRKWDKTASSNPLSHGFAVTAFYASLRLLCLSGARLAMSEPTGEFDAGRAPPGHSNPYSRKGSLRTLNL